MQRAGHRPSTQGPGALTQGGVLMQDPGVQLERLKHRLALGAREGDGGKWNHPLAFEAIANGEVTPLVTRWSRITCVCDFQNLHSTINKPQLFLVRNL